MVATGVVNGLEDYEGADYEGADYEGADYEGAGIDMDGVSPTLQTGVVPPIGRLSTLPSTARDYVRLSGSLFSNTTHQLSMVLSTRRCRGRLG